LIDTTVLHSQWARSWAALGLGPAPEVLCAELCQRYAEPHRKYHTLQHLAECLALCERDSALAQQPAEVAVALWFHDAVYELMRSDNEAASAAWAQRVLREAGASLAVAGRVHDMVMATRHNVQPSTPDAQLLVDIDLAILGATPARFAEYEQQIRDEYRHVPGLIFRMKRRAVLSGFLAREHLYATAAYRERYEAVARANLALAIEA
jgi:predicted metal-dependent HD superfamily phosphohydrolase